MRTKRPFLVLMVALAGLSLSACGGPQSIASFTPSTNCSVTPTNPDLAGCDLAGRNLSGDDLESDSLQGANLEGANLQGANLQGANLKGAKTLHVTTDKNTVCVNAEMGPCSEPGLRSPSKRDAAQGN